MLMIIAPDIFLAQKRMVRLATQKLPQPFEATLGLLVRSMIFGAAAAGILLVNSSVICVESSDTFLLLFYGSSAGQLLFLKTV